MKHNRILFVGTMAALAPSVQSGQAQCMAQNGK